MDNQATLVRHGTPLIDIPDFDFSGLTKAEEAVALLASPSVAIEVHGEIAMARMTTTPPADMSRGDASSGNTPPGDTSPGALGSLLGFGRPFGATDDVVSAIADRLGDLSRQWRELDDAAAIALTFSAPH